MPKLNTLLDLTRLREATLERLHHRERDGAVIAVGMGTCGIAAGARDILMELMTQLSEAKAVNVSVQQASCAGLCDREPIVTILKKGEAPVRYGKVTPEVVGQIIESHLINGKPLKEYLLANVAVK